jgi:hypothetical protein
MFTEAIPHTSQSRTCSHTHTHIHTHTHAHTHTHTNIHTHTHTHTHTHNEGEQFLTSSATLFPLAIAKDTHSVKMADDEELFPGRSGPRGFSTFGGARQGMWPLPCSVYPLSYLSGPLVTRTARTTLPSLHNCALTPQLLRSRSYSTSSLRVQQKTTACRGGEISHPPQQQSKTPNDRETTNRTVKPRCRHPHNAAAQYR